MSLADAMVDITVNVRAVERAIGDRLLPVLDRLERTLTQRQFELPLYQSNGVWNRYQMVGER